MPHVRVMAVLTRSTHTEALQPAVLFVQEQAFDRLVDSLLSSSQRQPHQIQVVGIVGEKYLTIGLVMPGRKHSMYIGHHSELALDTFAVGRLQTIQIRLENEYGLAQHACKLGRASCRERGCQYVKISVVAV